MEFSRLCTKLEKHTEALINANKGLRLDEACLGVDHPTYQESVKMVQMLLNSQKSDSKKETV